MPAISLRLLRAAHFRQREVNIHIGVENVRVPRQASSSARRCAPGQDTPRHIEHQGTHRPQIRSGIAHARFPLIRHREHQAARQVTPQCVAMFVGAHHQPIPGSRPGAGILLRRCLRRHAVEMNGFDPDAARSGGLRVQQSRQHVAQFFRRRWPDRHQSPKPEHPLNSPPKRGHGAGRRTENEAEPETLGKLVLPAESPPFRFDDRLDVRFISSD